MKRLSAIMFAFLLFGCQNEKSNEKINEKPDSNSLVSKTPNKIIDTSDFVEYWINFRQSVLNSDTNNLIKLTQFPIQTRGTFDSDPIIEYSKHGFPKIFNLFLKKGVGDASGNTQYDIIKSTEVPNEEIIHDQVRIGDMVFYFADKKWKLGFLYFDQETVDSIK